MDRRLFFSNLLVLVALFFAQALLLPGYAFCQKTDQFRVINVKSVVRLDRETEEDYKDFFVNYGSLKGAKIGKGLKVHRQIKVRSEVEQISDKAVKVPIGTLKIISVENDSCVARLVSVEEREDNPLAVYDTAMIGDYITPMKEKIKKKEVVILPGTILFDFDKYTLKPTAKATLNDLARKIAANGYKRVDIETHTDSIGSNTYNRTLSQNRAKSIYNYFVKERGFDRKIFTTKGHGETRPIASNKTKHDRQKNRRGVITFYK